MAKKKTTRRDKFLGRMEKIIPWAELLTVIAPFYPAGRRAAHPSRILVTTVAQRGLVSTSRKRA